jgi:hypothetical protein
MKNDTQTAANDESVSISTASEHHESQRRVRRKAHRGDHKMVLVKYGGFEAYIDKGIAPLIKELWKAGICTCLSCEENRPGWIWIDFGTAADAEAFLNIVARYEEDIDSFYNRVRKAWCRMEGEVVGAWEYNALVEDWAVDQTMDGDYVIESCCGPSNFNFSLSVRFPKSDYSAVLERMKEHNKAVRAKAGRVVSEWDVCETAEQVEGGLSA